MKKYLSCKLRLCLYGQLFLFVGIITNTTVYAQLPKMTTPTMYFLNTGIFFFTGYRGYVF